MAYQKLQAGRAAVVTPSNTVNIPNVASQDGSGNNGCVLYVGTKGNIKVMTVGGDEVTFTNIQDGSFIPVQVLRVFSTGTTASNIIALW
jgi:hypothetical protein